jgi:hypothetical protein
MAGFGLKSHHGGSAAITRFVSAAISNHRPRSIEQTPVPIATAEQGGGEADAVGSIDFEARLVSPRCLRQPRQRRTWWRPFVIGCRRNGMATHWRVLIHRDLRSLRCGCACLPRPRAAIEWKALYGAFDDVRLQPEPHRFSIAASGADQMGSPRRQRLKRADRDAAALTLCADLGFGKTKIDGAAHCARPAIDHARGFGALAISAQREAAAADRSARGLKRRASEKTPRSIAPDRPSNVSYEEGKKLKSTAMLLPVSGSPIVSQSGKPIGQSHDMIYIGDIAQLTTERSRRAADRIAGALSGLAGALTHRSPCPVGLGLKLGLL